MHSLKVIDVTLRDGGCVNNFDFGNHYMHSILTAEENAGLDCIEVGYLDDEFGADEGRTQFIDGASIRKFIEGKKQGIEYLAMMDYGRFDVNNLSDASGDGIDGIRLAFHKKDLFNIIGIGKTILKKGYKLYIQPMLTMHYSEKELLELINIVNTELPQSTALYIVDSFGEMRAAGLTRLFRFMNDGLNQNIAIGFHSHNNLQLSYSNAISFIGFETERELYVDSSILGMGKGAGNLNTELLLEHLNLYYGKSYSLMPLMEVIDEVLNSLKAEFNWGYSIEYYLSSKFHTSPSYANYFYNKHSLTVAQLSELLGAIDEEKKISFDKDYARSIYRDYKAKRSGGHKDDAEQIKEIMKNRTILLVAPGKNAQIYQERVNEIIKDENIVSVGLNNFELFPVQYVLITRNSMLEKAINSGQKVIALSNVVDNQKVLFSLEYKNWTVTEDDVFESSGVVALRLLEYCEPKKILLAGFDGFSMDVNSNYYDETMRYAYSKMQINSNNEFMKKYINKLRLKVEVEFVTSSAYETQ